MRGSACVVVSLEFQRSRVSYQQAFVGGPCLVFCCAKILMLQHSANYTDLRQVFKDWWLCDAKCGSFAVKQAFVGEPCFGFCLWATGSV